MKKVIYSFLCLAGFSCVAGAYDHKFLEQHIRKALNLDSRTQIEVSTQPKPSVIGNLWEVPVAVNGAPYQIFLSKDEKRYIWGLSFDLTVDPDEVRAQAIDLSKVHSKGSPSAPVTIVEFSDLECGYCKNAHETIKKELPAAYDSNSVRLVFKHFPLNGHPWAEPAAAAVECAAEQKESAFWDMTDLFFANNTSISTGTVKSEAVRFAGSLGIDAKKFKQCLDSNRTLQKVQNDKREGAALGVNSTPSLFVQGRLIRGFRSFDDIKIVVDEKLKEAKSKK